MLWDQCDVSEIFLALYLSLSLSFYFYFSLSLSLCEVCIPILEKLVELMV